MLGLLAGASHPVRGVTRRVEDLAFVVLDALGRLDQQSGRFLVAVSVVVVDVAQEIRRG